MTMKTIYLNLKYQVIAYLLKKGSVICYLHDEFTPTDKQKFKPSKKRLWEAQSIDTPLDQNCVF